MRNRHARKGNSLMEFAIITPFMFAILIGAFTLTAGMNRALQARQVVRDVNVLVVRSYDLSTTENQELILKAAEGLGIGMINGNGDLVADTTNGRGVIILTKVVKVGGMACNNGISNWNQQPATCPNYDQYVFASRLVIGNSSKGTSVTGTPSQTPDTYGNFSDNTIATSTANRATGFPDLIDLGQDEFVYVAEIFIDTGELNLVPKIVSMPNIYARSLS